MKTRQKLKQLYNTSEFQEMYRYDENDLGMQCTQAGTCFRLWSPLAEEVELRLYRDGKESACFRKIAMQKEERGVWSYQTAKDLHGIYYDYKIVREKETVMLGDPYAKACGVNGIRSMVVDLKKQIPQNGSRIKDRKKVKKILFMNYILKNFRGIYPVDFQKKTKESIRRLPRNTRHCMEKGYIRQAWII